MMIEEMIQTSCPLKVEHRLRDKCSEKSFSPLAVLVELVAFYFLVEVEIGQRDVPHVLHDLEFPVLLHQVDDPEELQSVSDGQKDVAHFLQRFIGSPPEQLHYHHGSHQHQQDQVDFVVSFVDELVLRKETD